MSPGVDYLFLFGNHIRNISNRQFFQREISLQTASALTFRQLWQISVFFGML